MSSKSDPFSQHKIFKFSKGWYSLKKNEHQKQIKSTSELIKLSRNLIINENTLSEQMSEASAFGASIFTQLIRRILTQQFSLIFMFIQLDMKYVNNLLVMYCMTLR